MENVLALVDAFLIVLMTLVLGYLGNDRFKAIERRLDRHEERTDQRFDRIDQRFERIDERFERMEERIDSVRADITRLALTLVPPREAEQT